MPGTITPIVMPKWGLEMREGRIAGWRALLEGPDEPVLLVTSNGAARFALVAAGLGTASGMKLPTGAYGVIERDAGGAPMLVEWGRRP